ncbi:MAG: murein biosynthesis integral membrane protein MurJ [Bacillota bacterium]
MATIILMVSNIFTKVVGMLRDVQLAAIYGAGIITDAYIVSMNIPTVLFASIGVALSTCFIPIYSEINELSGKEEALKFTNNLVNIVTIIAVLITIIGLIFTEQLVNLFAIGFEGESLQYAISFTRILIPSVLVIGLTNIFGCYLQLHKGFTAIGFLTVPQNLIIIASLYLSYKFNNVYILLWLTLFAIITQVIYYYPFIKKHGYKYGVYINLKDKNVRKALYLVGPVFFGVTVNQINILINRTLASTLGSGSISALNFADKINGFVTGIFVVSISTVIYPILSSLSAKKDYSELYKCVRRVIRIIIMIILPVSIFIMLCSEPIVRILFERGTFNVEATKMTSGALIAYAFGLVSFGMYDILLKAFFSIQDTKTPVKYGILSVLINISLSFILINYWGHIGLALAASFANLITSIALFYKFNKTMGNSGVKIGDLIDLTLIKLIISTIIMGMVIYFSYNSLLVLININSFISSVFLLFCTFMIGAIVYIITIFALKVEEMNTIKKILFNKFKEF